MPDQPVHEPSAQLSGATTVPLTLSSWDAVVNGLQRAADWTEGDIDCDDCQPERPW